MIPNTTEAPMRAIVLTWVVCFVLVFAGGRWITRGWRL
jgi:hypothetical protein